MFFIGNQRFLMFDSNEYAVKSQNTYGFILSGVMIAVGARLAKGCMSHVTQGLPLLNKQALLASLIIIVSGMAIGTLRGHKHFMDEGLYLGPTHSTIWKFISLGLFLLFTVIFAITIFLNRKRTELRDVFFNFGIGLIVGFGFAMSQLCRISKVRGFFKLGNGKWDPTVAFALLTIIVLNIISFSIIKRRQHSLLG